MAQEPPPPPPDSVPDRPVDLLGDTVISPPDSVPEFDEEAVGDAEELIDTLEAIHVLAEFPRGIEPRWSNGVWEWDRDLIQRSAAVTLTDLLERVPGITPVRSGFYGMPESVSAYGSTGGRLEIILDGYALDPLDAGSFDLSRLELAQLERVRVRRRGDGLRIELKTLAPADPEPYSVVEVATGDLRTNVFRGLFLAPNFLVGPLSLGVDRVDTRGLVGQEPASTFNGWVKWGLIGENRGLELELRNASITRTMTNESIVDGTRRDVVLRARGAPTDALTTEAFFGVSSIEDELTGTLAEESASQAGVRAALSAERGWLESTLRVRDHSWLPRSEAELMAGLSLPGRVDLSGDIIWNRWKPATKTRAYSIRAEAGPFLGVRSFVETSAGTRGVPGLEDDEELPAITDRTSYRVGAEVQGAGVHLGAAAVVADADSIATFGLPFEGDARLFPGGRIQGIEAVGHVPVPYTPFAVEGSLSWWDEAPQWIYTPQQSWRAALVYHGFPLGHDRFEIATRVGAAHRSAMRVPAPDIGTGIVPAHTTFNFYLQIRVLDVRAFVRWDNILHNLEVQDIPGRNYPGQRVLYGVKWQLWN